MGVGKNGFGWGGREEGKWGYVKPPTRKIGKNANLNFPSSLPFGSLKGINDFFGSGRFLDNVSGKIALAIFPFHAWLRIRRAKFSSFELLNSATPFTAFNNVITFASIITAATLFHKNTFYTIF